MRTNTQFTRSGFLRRPVLIFAIATALPVHAEIYRWTDAAGKTHFTGQKPSERASGAVEPFHGSGSLSIMGGGSAAGTSDERVKLYVKQWCPYCKKAKAFLNRRGTKYEELDVEASSRAKAEFDRMGGEGVPVFMLGKQRIDGFDADGMESLLRGAGL